MMKLINNKIKNMFKKVSSKTVRWYVITTGLACGILFVFIISAGFLLSKFIDFPDMFLGIFTLFFLGPIGVLQSLFGGCWADASHCLGDKKIILLIISSVFVFYGLLGTLLGRICFALKEKRHACLWFLIILVVSALVFNVLVFLALRTI